MSFPFQLNCFRTSRWCDAHLQALRRLMINLCVLSEKQARRDTCRVAGVFPRMSKIEGAPRPLDNLQTEKGPLYLNGKAHRVTLAQGDSSTLHARVIRNQ